MKIDNTAQLGEVMKITKRQLKRIIREEARKLSEAVDPDPRRKRQPTSLRNIPDHERYSPPADTRTVEELEADIKSLQAELKHLPVLSVAKHGLDAAIRADAKRNAVKNKLKYAMNLLDAKGSVTESRLRRTVRQEIAKLSNS